MDDLIRFVEVTFHRFKAFENFVVPLRTFNVLVGPNNAGKSTILASFRILAAALRRAFNRKPSLIRDGNSARYGYVVDLDGIGVAKENLFFNYDDSEPAVVSFKLANGARLKLHFPALGVCHLFVEDDRPEPKTPSTFRKRFNCPVGFVPILGPVDYREYVYQPDAARKALFGFGAARNFRNIWYHDKDLFSEFRGLLRETWPGMDIEPPVLDTSGDKPRLAMFCPEERIPREIFWAGFGFQVWCQMLTYLVKARDKALFIIDEPDIYLHSDLQRQLLGLLRDLGPDILVATHSTEIVTEAEPDDILVIDKKKKRARRIGQPSGLAQVFSALGSNLNPVLTQLAKTRTAVFVEGKDFQILSKFARKLGHRDIANRSQFAVIPIEGFNPERARSLKAGMEATLGVPVQAALILDRDFRSRDECSAISKECESFVEAVIIHPFKEVENALLVPAALDRAAERRVEERNRRASTALAYEPLAKATLESFARATKNHVMSRWLSARYDFDRRQTPGINQATSNERGLGEFEELWADAGGPLRLVQGKEALREINKALQAAYGISVTPTGIVDAMAVADVPEGVTELIGKLVPFAKKHPQ